MKVILTEDITSIGKMGEIISVKDGFGRNYLIPQKKALFAESKNLKMLEYTKTLVDNKRKKNLKISTSLAQKIETLSITITKKVGESEKLFGAVTDVDIVDSLKLEGVQIDKKMIQLNEPIKTLGIFTIPIKISSDVNCNLKLWVVSDNKEKPQAEKQEN